jgi:hypothetical protein
MLIFYPDHRRHHPPHHRAHLLPDTPSPHSHTIEKSVGFTHPALLP